MRRLALTCFVVAFVGCKGEKGSEPGSAAPIGSAALAIPAGSRTPANGSAASAGSATTHGPPSKLVVKMTEFKDAMCACKDEACTDKVVAEMNAFSNARALAQDPEPLSDGNDGAQLQVITRQLQDCIAKTLAR